MNQWQGANGKIDKQDKHAHRTDSFDLSEMVFVVDCESKAKWEVYCSLLRKLFLPTSCESKSKSLSLLNHPPGNFCSLSLRPSPHEAKVNSASASLISTTAPRLSPSTLHFKHFSHSISFPGSRRIICNLLNLVNFAKSSTSEHEHKIFLKGSFRQATGPNPSILEPCSFPV